MSSNPPELHGPTHSTRRGRQVSGGESNFLYKLIMVFNLIMTFVTTCTNENIVQNQSIGSTVSPNQAKGRNMQDIGDGYRWTVFIIMILLYILSAVAVLVLNFPTSDGIAKKILSVIEDLLLIFAGILYLSGDNILLLLRRFDAPLQIDTIEAKDLRSYLVAISLALMIISKIIPYMKKTVDNYRKPSQTLQVSHDGKNKTWEIRVPGGYHPEWKTNENWKLVEKANNSSDLQTRSAPELSTQLYPSESSDLQTQSAPELPTQESIRDENSEFNSQGMHVFPTTELVGKSTEQYIEAKVRYMKVSEEVRTEIDVTIFKKELVNGKPKKMCNCCCDSPCKGDKGKDYPQEQERKQDTQKLRLSMKGTSPKIKKTNESSSWKDTFQITQAQFNVDSEDQPNENPVKTRVPHNTAMSYLFDVYVYLIDYTLIADALYTTVLDEITHQDRRITEGYDCPKGHIAVAVIIWILLTLAWLIAVLSILVGSFCSNRYQRLGSWEDFKEKNLSIAPESIAKSIDLIPPWLRSHLKPKDNQETGSNKGNCNCKLWRTCCLWLIIYVGAIVFILAFAMVITLYILLWIIAVTNLCEVLIAVLSIVGIISLYVLSLRLTCILKIPLHCQNSCCGDSSDTRSCSSGHCDQMREESDCDCCDNCHRCCHQCCCSCCYQIQQILECCCSCCYQIQQILECCCSCCYQKCCSCFQCSMGCIVFLMTCILILYLPTYLIADNKFPWVCFLPNNDKTNWNFARFGLLIASFCMTTPFTAYQLITNKVKPFLNKLNYDYGQLSTSQQQNAA